MFLVEWCWGCECEVQCAQFTDEGSKNAFVSLLSESFSSVLIVVSSW